MASSGNRAILVLLAGGFVLAGLVTLFGYPQLIWAAVTAAFAALALFVALSAGDILEKPSTRTAEREVKLEEQTATA